MVDFFMFGTNSAWNARSSIMSIRICFSKVTFFALNVGTIFNFTVTLWNQAITRKALGAINTWPVTHHILNCKLVVPTPKWITARAKKYKLEDKSTKYEINRLQENFIMVGKFYNDATLSQNRWEVYCTVRFIEPNLETSEMHSANSITDQHIH